MSKHIILSFTFFYLLDFQAHALNPFYDQFGMKILYDPRCNSTFTGKGTNYTIMTPNFPNAYDSDLYCGWMIETTEDAADIIINIDLFHLESSNVCLKYDYVMFYKQDDDGKPWQQVGHKEGYCGEQDSFTIQETTKRMFIQFFSDISREFPGFNATFHIVVTRDTPTITCLQTKKSKSCNETSFDVEGDSEVMLTCKAYGMPPATYKWERFINATHSVAIRAENIKLEYQNGSLLLHRLSHENDGIYRCIATNKYGSSSREFELEVTVKCLCPETLLVGWYPNPPYTKFKSGNREKGIFFELLEDIVSTICGKCKHSHDTTKVVWNNFVNIDNRKLGNLKEDILQEKYDIYLPIEGLATDTIYRNDFRFLPIMESPGVALIVAGNELSADSALFTSITEAWPLFALIIILAVIAGIVIWILETYWNPEQFPNTFSNGVLEGFWWALVTMTTVGYGDIAPTGIPGRLFAVFWILTGIVIVAIFTSVITTSLTVSAFSSDVKLYGSRIGAINSSAEYYLGVIRNANMTEYSSYIDLATGLEMGEVEGVLLDVYVAAHYKTQFSKFRINNIFTKQKSYGIVFSRALGTNELLNNFITFLQIYSSNFTKIVEQNMNLLGATTTSAAEEATSHMYTPTDPLFIKSVVGVAALLILFTIAGLFFEFKYLRPRSLLIEKAKNMIYSQELRERTDQAIQRNQEIIDLLDKFYEKWSTEFKVLTEKHKKETKLFRKDERLKRKIGQMSSFTNVEMSPNVADGDHGFLGKHFQDPVYDVTPKLPIINQ